MPIIEWHDSAYAIGLEEIDRQHRDLIAMINDAYDAAASGEQGDRIVELVQRMAAYAERHFATEEGLMRVAGYEAGAAHHGQHEEFAGKVQKYSAALLAGGAPRPEEVFRYLAEWLSGHILEVDAAFGRWLKRNPPRS